MFEKNRFSGSISIKMKTSLKLLFAGSISLLLLSRCNTLENIQTIDLEIFVPANIIFPPNYKNVAVRYNNTNFTFNKLYAESPNAQGSKKDTLNTDSIAFVSYYNSFLETIKNQQFFDSVNVIQPENYSGYSFSDSLFNIDSVKSKSSPFRSLAYVLTHIKNDKTNNNPVKYINPELGLYTRNELEKVADTTNSDILLSLDLLSAFYGIDFDPDAETGFSVVYNIAFWNFYDLKEMKIIYQYDQIDTIAWQSSGVNYIE